ncbi:MAG TPA: tetratricopeptide repeat protein [Polyangiaceae bacterium]|nr:tetratricopeptide repeat protein [Polyangiaceae bacterium]
MDCEKFDRIVLDLLYDELDELTSAAAKRHMEHCARCRAIGSGLRATREVGALPLVEPPEGLEQRILRAEEQAAHLLPIGKRLGRGLSLLASYAMRPQVSMAALLMLMIGSSLFFLRAQPGDREHVLVTERGVPESDNESVTIVPKKPEAAEAPRAAHATPPAARAEEAAPRRDRAPEPKLEAPPAAPAAPAAAAAPAPAYAPRPMAGRAVIDGTGIAAPAEDKELEGSSEPSIDSDASFDAAMAAYRDGRYSEAQHRFDEIASLNGPHAASAALYGAQALRRVSGCPTAAPRFEEVRARYPSSVGSDAAWQAADCYRTLGDLPRARQTYEQLAADPNYKARAKEAIAELDQRAADQELAARKAAAAAPAPAAKPKAATSSAPAKAAPSAK